MSTNSNLPNLCELTDRHVRRDSVPGIALPTAPDARFDREDERLKTFDSRWPSNSIDISLLARTGMYFIGLRDTTQCHFCGIGLSEWQPYDHPVDEHLKYAPNCPLLRHQSTKNVPIDSAALNQILCSLNPDVCGIRQMPSNSNNRDCSVSERAAPAFPNFALEAKRIESFVGWPKIFKSKIDSLAGAGFFYGGYSDQVQCFSCGGTLQDWEDRDNPWEQHAIWHSSCKYLRLILGKEYIEECIAKYEKSHKEPEVQPGPEEPVPFDRQISALSSCGGQIDDDNMCKLCFVELRNTVFLPCGHVVACAKCASSLTKCPVCRISVTDVQRLYFS